MSWMVTIVHFFDILVHENNDNITRNSAINYSF